MRSNRVTYAFALALIFAVATPLLAAPKNNSEMMLTGNIFAKGRFTLAGSKSLNGTTLQAGEYKVIVSGSQVSFLRKGRVLAQAPIQWKDVQLTDSNAVVDDGGNIREVRFKGKRRSVLIL